MTILKLVGVYSAFGSKLSFEVERQKQGCALSAFEGGPCLIPTFVVSVVLRNSRT